MVTYFRFCLPALVFGLVAGGEPVHLAAQGFSQGMLLKSKKTVTLHRKLPAAVHLKEGTLAVKTASRDPKNNVAVQKLVDTLQAELLKYNNQFKIDDNKPDTLVFCNITDLLIPGTKITSRTAPVTNKVNGKWQTTQQVKQFQEISGSISVAYNVKDVRTGKVLDADNLTGKYHEEFDAGGNKTDGGNKALGNIKKSLQNFGKKNTSDEKADDTPPTPAELQQILVGKIVQQVAARLTTTDEKVEVEMARGPSLDEYNDFAEKGLWNRMLEPLETMKPLETPEKDSFRLYNIGVGYEALAYSAEDVKNAKKYLDEAAVNYGKAVDANPHQKEFLDAQNRISTAQAHYAKLGSQTMITKNASAPDGSVAKASSSGPAGASPKSATAEDVLTNEQVIEFVKNGLDEENLVGIIKDAPKTNFDLTTNGMMELVKGGVKGKVLTAMRARAHPPAHRASAAAKPPVAKTTTQ